MTAKGKTTSAPAQTDDRVMLREGPIAWINVTHIDDSELQKELVTTAIEQGFAQIVVPPERATELAGLGRFQALTLAPAADGSGSEVRSPDGVLGRWVTLHDKHDEAAVSAMAGVIDVAIVSATDWKIIPLENLIADYQPTRSALLAEVTDAQGASVMLSTLEVGTDGILLSPSEPQDVIDLRNVLSETQEIQFNLEEAEVTSVEDAGIGERVCIDTCSLLRPGEGMLVGGSAKGMFLIHSESLESPYVNARPFRVNAGAVYAYVMGTGGRTHYLSEVNAGLPLLAVDHAGKARTVTVGRAKVETRPMFLVKARPVADPAIEFAVIVQNAETIRFVTPDGGALSVADVQPGDRILLNRMDAARHFGRPIQESIVEK